MSSGSVSQFRAENGQTRPALVLQRDNLASGLQKTIVAMISSNLARRGHPSRTFVGAATAEGKAGGLRLHSVIMTDSIAAAFETEIDSVLGHLPNMSAVDAALKPTLALV